MPVDFESHSLTDFPDKDTNSRYTLDFLADDPDLGFRPIELAETLDVPHRSAETTLRRLEHRGHVRYKCEIGL